MCNSFQVLVYLSFLLNFSCVRPSSQRRGPRTIISSRRDPATNYTIRSNWTKCVEDTFKIHGLWSCTEFYPLPCRTWKLKRDAWMWDECLYAVCSYIWERRSVFLTFWLQCQCPSCKSHTTDKRSSFGKKTLEMDISKQHLLYWYWLHMSRLKYGNCLYFQRVLFSIFFFTPAQLKRQNEKEPALCFLLNAKKKVLTMASAQWIGQAMLDWFPPLICGRREMPFLQLPFFLASSKTKVRCTGSEGLGAYVCSFTDTQGSEIQGVCNYPPATREQQQ